MPEWRLVLTEYERLLAAIGERAADIGDRPVVTHWPHVGAAYGGLIVVGQPLYGWPEASARGGSRLRCWTVGGHPGDPSENSDGADPLDWIGTHPVRVGSWVLRSSG